jgi:dTDP-4-amino-4,6-dideoxygalactose transaminase
LSGSLADKLRVLRCHGAQQTYLHEVVGVNSHLHAIQAAVLHVKLAHLDRWNAARREKAARYEALLGDVAEVTMPFVDPGNEHVYHQYVIRIPDRDAARDYLRDRGIGCAVFYPLPLHMQPCFASLKYRPEDCPEALRASREVLALPIYPELTDEQQREVVGAIKEFLASR